MITHYLICREHGTIKNLTAYENRVTAAVKDVIPGIKTANFKKTTICLKEKLLCVAFENLCDSNKFWNLREMLKFFQDVMRYLPGPYWKTRRSIINTLLEGQGVEYILTWVQPFCPENATEYCNKERRKKRDLSTANILSCKETNLNSERRSSLKREKRALEPLEMMGLFNTMVCNQDIVVSIAEYYQKNFPKLPYNRVWSLKNFATIWCCFVENLQELYHSTPDN